MISYRSYFVLLIQAAVVLVGAAGQSLKTASLQNGSGTPTTAATTPYGILPDYRIGPGDVLSVDVWKEPDASIASAIVRLDGRVSLPLIGEVQVAGMTPQEVQQSASARYSRIIRDALVNVAVREVNSQRVYVIGEVRREGAIRVVTPLTVLQALADSGGLTDYAKKKKIYILRLQGGRQTKLSFDYDAVVKGRKVEQNIMLLPGDTVVVPR